MLKKTEKKAEKKADNSIPKFNGIVSKKVKKAAAIDLAVDVLCPPLGAIRHFKRGIKVANTAEVVEQAVDTALANYSLEDLEKIGESIVGSSMPVEEKTEVKEKEEEKEEA